MRWFARSPAIDTWLGTTLTAVAHPGQAPQWQPLAPGLSAEQRTAALLDRLPQAPHRAINLWLSAALARPFMCGPLAGVRRWHEARTVAAAMAPEATGLAGPCTVWLAAPVHRRCGLAVAVQNEVLNELRQQTQARGMALRSVRPWWSAAFNAVADSAGPVRLVVVDDGEALTSLRGEGGSIVQAATPWPPPDAAHRSGWVARHLAAADVQPGQVLMVQLARELGPPDDRLPAVPLGARLLHSLTLADAPASPERQPCAVGTAP